MSYSSRYSSTTAPSSYTSRYGGDYSSSSRDRDRDKDRQSTNSTESPRYSSYTSKYADYTSKYSGGNSRKMEEDKMAKELVKEHSYEKPDVEDELTGESKDDDMKTDEVVFHESDVEDFKNESIHEDDDKHIGNKSDSEDDEAAREVEIKADVKFSTSQELPSLPQSPIKKTTYEPRRSSINSDENRVPNDDFGTPKMKSNANSGWPPKNEEIDNSEKAKELLLDTSTVPKKKVSDLIARFNSGQVENDASKSDGKYKAEYGATGNSGKVAKGMFN